mgnify:CR=1 FL=1
MGVFPPVCKAMSADVLRLSFVSLCVSSIVLKVYSPCGLYVQNLTGAQACEKTHFRTWACILSFIPRKWQTDTLTTYSSKSV